MMFTVDEDYFLMPTGFNLVGGVRLVGVNTVDKLPRILRPISDEQGANAAVALLLKPKGGDFEVLLVRRVENRQILGRDKWLCRAENVIQPMQTCRRPSCGKP